MMALERAVPACPSVCHDGVKKELWGEDTSSYVGKRISSLPLPWQLQESVPTMYTGSTSILTLRGRAKVEAVSKTGQFKQSPASPAGSTVNVT